MGKTTCTAIQNTGKMKGTKTCRQWPRLQAVPRERRAKSQLNLFIWTEDPKILAASDFDFDLPKSSVFWIIVDAAKQRHAHGCLCVATHHIELCGDGEQNYCHAQRMGKIVGTALGSSRDGMVLGMVTCEGVGLMAATDIPPQVSFVVQGMTCFA